VSEMASGPGAIVISGWSWENRNVPERPATALSRAGWRDLYCSNPSSFLRGRGEIRSILAGNVEGFGPKLVGHRLKAFPSMRRWQAGLLVNQVLEQPRQMNIARPVVFYPHGGWIVEFAREIKRRNITDPRRQERRRIAGAHSMDEMAKIPTAVLGPALKQHFDKRAK
jgi:hypothetical protein